MQNDDDFGMAAQHGSLPYKLCVNLVEGKSFDISSPDEAAHISLDLRVR